MERALMGSLEAIAKALPMLYRARGITFYTLCREVASAFGMSLSNARRYLSKVRDTVSKGLIKLTTEVDLRALGLCLAVVILRNAKVKEEALNKPLPYVRSIAPLIPRGVAITLFVPRPSIIIREFLGEGLYLVEDRMKNAFDMLKYLDTLAKDPTWFLTPKSLRSIVERELESSKDLEESESSDPVSVSYELLLVLSKFENDPLAKIEEVTSYIEKVRREEGLELGTANARTIALRVARESTRVTRGVRLLHVAPLRDYCDASILIVLRGSRHRDSRRFARALLKHPVMRAAATSSDGTLIVNAAWSMSKVRELIHEVVDMGRSLGLELVEYVVSKRGAGVRFGLPCIPGREFALSARRWLPLDSMSSLRGIFKDVIDYM